MRLPISPAQRWVLANLFLSRSLSLNGGITQDVVYNRTRAALGLRGPMTLIMKGREANRELIEDTEPNACCDLSDENRDFLLDRIFPLEKVPWQSAVLETFIENILDWKRGTYSQDAMLTNPTVTDLKETWNVQEKGAE